MLDATTHVVDDNYVSHQDSAAVHDVCNVVQLLQHKTLHF